METRSELIAAVGERYRASARAEKAKILDEFTAVSGYHRKHAIRLLRPGRGDRPHVERRPSGRYGAEVREALAVLWEASDRLCSKRLKPMIPVLLPAFERHSQLAPTDTLRELLLAVSPATMDRLLSGVRLCLRERAIRLLQHPFQPDRRIDDERHDQSVSGCLASTAVRAARDS